MNRTRTFAAIGIGLATAFTFAGTASAAPPDLETARARCIAEIGERQVQLDILIEKASASAQLTDTHEGTIGSFVSAAKAGLADLQAEIEGDTDAASLRADCEAIATEYRVYALRTPQVHVAIAGDRTAAGVVMVSDIAIHLQDAIDAAAAAGTDVTEATALMAELQGNLSAANASLSGVVDSELGYAPSDWNANHSVLTPAMEAVRLANANVKSAIGNARAIVAELKA